MIFFEDKPFEHGKGDSLLHILCRRLTDVGLEGIERAYEELGEKAKCLVMENNLVEFKHNNIKGFYDRKYIDQGIEISLTLTSRDIQYV